MRALLVGGALLFGLGGCMGSKMASPEVDIVKVPGPTKTVTKTETKTEYVFPDACAKALAEAHEIWKYGGHLYDNGDRQVKIIQDVRLYLGQGKDLDSLYLRQNRLHSDEVADVEAMAQAMYKFSKFEEECEESK